MLDFICYLFFGIGLTAALFGAGYGAVVLIDKIHDAAQQGRERFQRLVSALERIEANTRSKPNQG